MRGRIISLDRENRKGRVDTRNDQYRVLTIYFGNAIPEGVSENCTVEFEVVRSRYGNNYAKFQYVVERNAAVFNTEDRAQWYGYGEALENDFIRDYVPRIGRDIRINPEKATNPTVIDFMDYTDVPAGAPCDLKTQKTPFFTSARYTYTDADGRAVRYDPMWTVTFNRKDYEKYSREYPDCKIYFHAGWEQSVYGNLTVDTLDGVWVADFSAMCRLIEQGQVALHAYQNRQDDDHNARCSYLFDLRDTRVFARLL